MKPSFTVVAGPNGSGKSSLTAGSSDIFRHFPLIDPDAIARTIQINSKNPSVLAAGRVALSQAASFLETRRSFAVETTLSGHNYLQMMTEARERGFEVLLIYVGTKNSDINIARVADRVALGGHDVPEADIRRRYERSLRKLPLAIARADHAILPGQLDGFRIPTRSTLRAWDGSMVSRAAVVGGCAQFSPSLSSPPSTSTADNPTNS